MKWINLFWQRAVQALCLCLLFCCNKPVFQQWQVQEIKAKSRCFSSCKLFLPPDEKCEYLEVEILRNCSGVRFYVNLLNVQARPLQEDLHRTKITITFPDSEQSYQIFPHLLAGGQCLLLNGEDADQLIALLLKGQECFLSIGRHQLRLVTTRFAEHYQTLMNVEIDEKNPCDLTLEN